MFDIILSYGVVNVKNNFYNHLTKIIMKFPFRIMEILSNLSLQIEIKSNKENPGKGISKSVEMPFITARFQPLGYTGKQSFFCYCIYVLKDGKQERGQGDSMSPGGVKRQSLLAGQGQQPCPGKVMPASLYTGYYLTHFEKKEEAMKSGCLKKESQERRRRIKLTRHNGRSGRNGVYNPKHNDRQFNLENSEHIDSERAARNIYWDWLGGFLALAEQKEDYVEDSFEEVEKLFYDYRYGDHVNAQNARNAKTRHTERNRSTADLLKNKKTCPEETIYQIGTMEDHASAEALFSIVTEFMAEMEKRFGEHFHILDFALHVDEGSPHIHERHVFDCENKYGEVCPQQEKALETLGFELPDPSKRMSRSNNRKIAFDAACRVLLFDICKKHGLHLEEEPEYGGRKYLEKQDYIRMKQQEEIRQKEKVLERQEEELARQEQTMKSQSVHMKIQRNTLENMNQLIREKNETLDGQEKKMRDNDGYIEFQDKVLKSVESDVSRQKDKLEQLNMQIEDVEELINEVSEIAYDKAVEVVTEAVQDQTRREDIAIIQAHQDWLNYGEKKFSKEHLKYSNMTLDRIRQKLMNAAGRVLEKVNTALKNPDVKMEKTEEIRKKVRPSVLARLNEKKRAVSGRDGDRKQVGKKRYFGMDEL